MPDWPRGLGAGAGDGATSELWVVALFDRRVERVHIDVDDLSGRHIQTLPRQEWDLELGSWSGLRGGEFVCRLVASAPGMRLSPSHCWFCTGRHHLGRRLQRGAVDSLGQSTSAATDAANGADAQGVLKSVDRLRIAAPSVNGSHNWPLTQLNGRTRYR
jgi:hypothetical protein